MKKILSFLSLALVALTFVSCSNNSPEGAVTQYFSYVKDAQYEKAVDMLYFKKGKLADKDKEQLVSLFTDKVAKQYDEKGGISSVTIDKVEMEEDGKAALVSYTINFGDGSTKSDNNKVLNIDGEWLLDSGK